jgi:hypothetical protein
MHSNSRMTPLLGVALAVVAAGCLVLLLTIAQRATLDSTGESPRRLLPGGGRGDSITLQNPSHRRPGDDQAAEATAPGARETPVSNAPGDSIGNPLERLAQATQVTQVQGAGPGEGELPDDERFPIEPYSGGTPEGSPRVINQDGDEEELDQGTKTDQRESEASGGSMRVGADVEPVLALERPWPSEEELIVTEIGEDPTIAVVARLATRRGRLAPSRDPLTSRSEASPRSEELAGGSAKAAPWLGPPLHWRSAERSPVGARP